MPDVSFEVTGARPVLFAASPLLALDVRITAPAGETIQSILLRAQIRVEPKRRSYTDAERAALAELFGGPTVWEQGAKPLLWANVSVTVPTFTNTTTAELHLPCTYDLRAGAAKYFHSLDGGRAPLVVLFSGTVFHVVAGDPPGGGGALRAAPLSWEKECRFALPADTWNAAIDAYFPESAGLVLPRALVERLERERRRRGAHASLEKLLEALLDERR